MARWKKQYYITEDMDAATLQLETDDAIERLRRIRSTSIRKLARLSYQGYPEDDLEVVRLIETCIKIDALNLE